MKQTDIHVASATLNRRAYEKTSKNMFSICTSLLNHFRCVQIGNVEVVEAKAFQNFNYEEKDEGIYMHTL